MNGDGLSLVRRFPESQTNSIPLMILVGKQGTYPRLKAVQADLNCEGTEALLG
jgi:hypothetical protein